MNNAPDWMKKLLPLIGWIARELAKQEIAPLLLRIQDLENRMSEFQYCGVWHEGTYRRGNFVTHDGSVWHCNVDTFIKPGTDPVVWTLAVKHCKDFTDPPTRRLPTKGGARDQQLERRT